MVLMTTNIMAVKLSNLIPHSTFSSPDFIQVKKTISFTEKLNSLSEKYDIFSDVRSAGLWIGCDFKKVKSSDFIQAAYNEGLIVVQAAGEKTIRLAPSLIISDKEINEGFKRFEKAYKNII